MTNVKKALEFIPPDSLYWSQEEQKFVLLSDEELQQIITDCIVNLNMEDPEDMMGIIKEFENLRISALFLQEYLKGRISFAGIKGGHLTWVVNENHDN